MISDASLLMSTVLRMSASTLMMADSSMPRRAVESRLIPCTALTGGPVISVPAELCNFFEEAGGLLFFWIENPWLDQGFRKALAMSL